MTTIYLVRHSKTLKVDNFYCKDNFQIQNEKRVLSVDGEKIAAEWFKNDLFSDIDYVYSSNYTRAIATAKYVAWKNDLKINVLDDLGERKFGVTSFDEIPDDFERKQFLDENYKIFDGESQKEVRKRMFSAILEILDRCRNKKVVVVSHGTAISYLLRKWCDVLIINDKLRYSFNGKILLDGYFNYCETFKLDFDDENNLINIENIKLK